VVLAESVGTRRTCLFPTASTNGYRQKTSINVGTVTGNRLAWSLLPLEGATLNTEKTSLPGQDDHTPVTAVVVGPIGATEADVVPPRLNEQVREYIRSSKAASTIRGYQGDWRDFCAWCDVRELKPLPAAPETIAAYIADGAERLKPGSLERRLHAIAEAHKAMGLESPTHSSIVANTMKGIRRVKGTAQTQKAPALTEDIRAMVDVADTGVIGTRDRAMILLGFAGAFRRSELVGLAVEDCAFNRDGLTIFLRRSKTDQTGDGRRIGIPYGSSPFTCPVRTIQSWLEQAGISTGPLFRAIHRHGQVQIGGLSGIDVARVVKKLATRAGLDASKFAGHSLRSGHATSAAIAGASERSIMNQTGHRSTQMVRRYIRDGNLFRENSAGKLGL
jgi:site-specific recombinase XerD